MSIDSLYKLFQLYPSVQTDTRKLRPGDIFFALKGDRFNGNEFASNALEAGAALVVVDESIHSQNEGKVIKVDNVLETLQGLAKFHRQQFKIPFIAITGSNGKTTTKELIHAVLSSTFKTYTTEGNLNNQIGIPLTLLKVKADAEMAVVEMGANHLREIAGYCTYTLPDYGLITNCGKAHLEGFGSLEGVRKAKGELYDYLRENLGTAFVMWDYPYLREMSSGIPKVITYGTSNAGITGSIKRNEPFLEIEITGGIETMPIRTKLVGEYNLPNILAAVCVGNEFGVTAGKIKSAIENYEPSNSRSQLLTIGSNKIILDAYNANPTSMKAAIENFANLKADNKILVLGGMAELGQDSLKEHEGIVNLIYRHKWKEVALVGGDFLVVKSPYRQFENAEAAARWYNEQNFRNSYFLIKGSRSMQMERVLGKAGPN
jgi:UDP-N-acetylmuramoyl-tripeptide--D-alanyl-D-alanine ligase